MIRYLERALWPTVALVLLSACLCGCATIGQFPPGGRVCKPGSDASEDCACLVFVIGKGWVPRFCPEPPPTPAPSITPSPSPSSTPTPVPTPTPTPSPSPTPSPCTPQVEAFVCPAGTSQCWRCSERIQWDVERGNWIPLPNSTLLYNDPGNDPQHREYLDRACNYVRRDGSIIRTAEQQFGVACQDGQAICPTDRLTPCPSPTPGPSPSPSTSPTPGPTPTPGTCPACSEIELCGIGAQVHQFQNRQAQTVPYHREGDGGFIYVPDGPVIGGKVQTDQTPYYKPKVNPPGGCGPKFSCNGEGEFWGKCCEKCEKPGVWTQVSGPRLDWVLYNNDFGIDGRIEQPGYYEFKTCGTNQGRPDACKLIAWRITQ